MNVEKETCKIEVQIELNRQMYAGNKITTELYHKVNNILVKRLEENRI